MTRRSPPGANELTDEHQAEVRQPPPQGVSLGKRAVVGLGIALVILAVPAWVLLRDDDAAEEPPPPVAARIVPVDELRDLAAAEGAVYWVGPRAGVRYEFSRTEDGIHVRYLPEGVEAGTATGRHLTVGTYRVDDAFAATQRTGEAEGAVTRALRGGGIAVYNRNAPTSVYVAYPDGDRQIEIFHPSPARARQLAFSGAVTPILPERGATPEERGEPVEATRARLEQVAAETDHPVYWLGPIPGRKYELTRLPNGQIYIRYLPRDVDIGDYRPRWVTVGTFPVDDALAAMEAEASRTGAVTFDVPGGGRAYYHETTPANVHFALPDSDFQVEVFHPSPGRAQELVRSGQVVPIR